MSTDASNYNSTGEDLNYFESKKDYVKVGNALKEELIKPKKVKNQVFFFLP